MALGRLSHHLYKVNTFAASLAAIRLIPHTYFYLKLDARPGVLISRFCGFLYLNWPLFLPQNLLLGMNFFFD
jgi:hypothetical protein